MFRLSLPQLISILYPTLVGMGWFEIANTTSAGVENKHTYSILQKSEGSFRLCVARKTRGTDEDDKERLALLPRNTLIVVFAIAHLHFEDHAARKCRFSK